MIVTYEGGLDSVDVKLPTRWLFGVNRGDTVEVTPEESELLLIIPGWKPEQVPTTPTPSTEDES